MKKNYKEDFTAVIRMHYPDGVTAGIPDYDFDMHFTSGFTEYTAGRRNGQLYRCSVSDADPTVLLVRFDNHGLHPCPSLGLRVVYHIPDSDFPDGFRDIPQTYPTDICLTVGASDIPTAAEINIILPYIKGDPGKDGKDGKDAAPYDDTEIRREIVGLWDATAEMQAKLADLYSTETRNLLKRLGYNDDDIEEYIWAVAHLDLNISLDQLRESVKLWEKYGIAEYSQLNNLAMQVAPKWTEEMEAGNVTLFDFYYTLRGYARYIPRITTSQRHPFGREYTFSNLLYLGGVHLLKFFQNSFANNIYLTAPSLRGIGTITGLVSYFGVEGHTYKSSPLKYIGKFKSDLEECGLGGSFQFCYQLYDFRGVDWSNSVSLAYFCGMGGYLRKVKILIPDGALLPPVYNAQMGDAFYDRWFDGAKFELCPPVVRPAGVNLAMFSSYFSNCVIDFTTPHSTTAGGEWPGVCWAVSGTINKVNIPYQVLMYMTALKSELYYNSPENSYGVWEVNAPMLEALGALGYEFSFQYMNVTLFNVGGNCHQPKTNVFPIDKIMRPYYFNSDSFVRGLRSWVSVPADGRPCGVTMLPTQFEVIPEDVIADLSEKGFTISVV